MYILPGIPQMIVRYSRLLSSLHDGNMCIPKGKDPTE